MSALRRLRGLAADAGVRATAATRILALAGAPVSLWLAATKLAPGEQGFYFVAVNVISLAQVFEIGLATIIVQHASHEWPRLVWGKGGRLEGDPEARAAITRLLRAAGRWYGLAALGLLVFAGLGGVIFFGSAYGDSVLRFALPWCGFVVLVAMYLPLIPFVGVAEGCGALVDVQRMRSWQAVALLAGLSTGILTSGPLTAAWLGASAQLLTAMAWLAVRYPVLLRAPAVESTHSSEVSRPRPNGFRQQQRRSAQLWLALWLAPQLLTPITLSLHGGDAAGRFGITFAVAYAALSLALAWLHGRYPSFGALVSSGRTPEFDALARRAASEAIAVFLAAAATLTGAVMVLPFVLPTVASRVLPLPSLFALFAGALASLLLQAMAAWLRAFRDETLAGPIVTGAVATVFVTGTAAALGGPSFTAVAFAAASLGIAVPLAAVRFFRMRRELLLQHSATPPSTN